MAMPFLVCGRGGSGDGGEEAEGERREAVGRSGPCPRKGGGMKSETMIHGLGGGASFG